MEGPRIMRARRRAVKRSPPPRWSRRPHTRVTLAVMPKPCGRTPWTTVLAVVVALVAGPVTAAAAEASANEAPAVPIAANFSVAERVTIVTVAVTGALALTAAPRLFQPAPSLGP